ncbi:MAG: inositol-3-phosphate synthase [Acidimicrobiales bacterium]
MPSTTIAPAAGRLGVLTPGLGAVASTFVAGVLSARAGHTVPVGSLSQLAHIRLGERSEDRNPLIRDFVPLAALDDLVFGGWDPISANALEAARTAGVLEERDLAPISGELEGVVAMDAVFDQRWVSKLTGTRVKTAPTKFELAEARSPTSNGSAPITTVTVCRWCGAGRPRLTRIISEVHASVAAFEEGLRAQRREHRPSQIYAYAALVSWACCSPTAPQPLRRHARCRAGAERRCRSPARTSRPVRRS